MNASPQTGVTAQNQQGGLEVLASDVALVRLRRELVVGRGADRIRFLHGLLTADISGTSVGQGRRAALLTAKGHVVSDLRVFVRSDEVWMMVEEGQGAPTADALGRFAIMDDFRAAPEPAVRFLAVLGPRAGERLALAGVDVAPLETEPLLVHRDYGTLWIARSHELGVDGFYLGGSATELDAVGRRVADAGGAWLSEPLAEAARVAAREPRFGAEIGPDSFPQEVGLNEVIDYTKGCYLGQETIVRIRDRGQVNWQLASLLVTDPADPSPGDRIESDHRPRAGKVTSYAHMPDGRRLALVILHASIKPGTTVRIHHGELPLLARVLAPTATGNTPAPVASQTPGAAAEPTRD